MLSFLLTAALLAPPAPGPAVTSTVLLKTATTWNGAPIVYAASAKPEVQSVLVEIPAGGSTAWHRHPVNNIAYLLEGSLRVELEDGRSRAFQAGEAFAEVVGTWHRGLNTGKGPVKILVVYLGEAGMPLSEGKAKD